MLQHVKVGHIALSQNGHFYFWAKKGPPDLFTTQKYIICTLNGLSYIFKFTGSYNVVISFLCRAGVNVHF